MGARLAYSSTIGDRRKKNEDDEDEDEDGDGA